MANTHATRISIESGIRDGSSGIGASGIGRNIFSFDKGKNIPAVCKAASSSRFVPPRLRGGANNIMRTTTVARYTGF